jgi:ornithine carbamoyltransferase
VLDLAARMKAEPGGWTVALPGRALPALFEKPSTRTRSSLAVAAHRLGMLPLTLRPDELQLVRGETIADTARVLSGYAAAIAVRTFAQATPEELAAHATVPVINALSDEHHPCQALASYGPLRRLLLGSTSAKLVHEAACPVLVLPRGVKEADPAPVTAASAEPGAGTA